MHDTCPECGHQFGREPGYFTGAMYASYTLAVPLLFIIFVGLWSLFSTTWTLMFNLLVSFLLFLPFVPIIYRYSRVIWMADLRPTKDHRRAALCRQQGVP